MGTWAENQQHRAALERWRHELEIRMARADVPWPMTAEEKADVAIALMAHANDKLPDGHPQKVTEADVFLVPKLRALLPPVVIVDVTVQHCEPA